MTTRKITLKQGERAVVPVEGCIDWPVPIGIMFSHGIANGKAVTFDKEAGVWLDADGIAYELVNA